MLNFPLDVQNKKKKEEKGSRLNKLDSEVFVSVLKNTNISNKTKAWILKKSDVFGFAVGDQCLFFKAEAVSGVSV